METGFSREEAIKITKSLYLLPPEDIYDKLIGVPYAMVHEIYIALHMQYRSLESRGLGHLAKVVSTTIRSMDGAMYMIELEGILLGIKPGPVN